jgi:hypothetical protein
MVVCPLGKQNTGREAMTVNCDKCDDTGYDHDAGDYYISRLCYCDCPAGEALRRRELAERDNDANRGIDRARERAEEKLI